MSNSLWTTLKKIGINLPISPSNPSFHPAGHDYPIKKNVFSFTRNPYEFLVLPRVWAKGTREKKRYTLAEPCYYSLSRSRSFRNCRVALLLCLFVMGLMVFFVCLFVCLTVFVFNVIFRFRFVHYHSNMHACMLFFGRKISHPSSHPFIRRPFIIPPTCLSILQTGHE